MGRALSTHGEIHTQFWSEKLKGRDLSENLGIYGMEWILGISCGKMWTELIWFRTGDSGGFL